MNIEKYDNEFAEIELYLSSSSNDFKPVDRTINEKQILPTVSLSKDAEELYIKDNLAEKLD